MPPLTSPLNGKFHKHVYSLFFDLFIKLTESKTVSQCRGFTVSVGSPRSDSTVPGSSLEPHEALLPPAGAPGVLDEPEVLASLTAVAHHRHGVVGRAEVSLATPGVVVDAATVVEQVGSLNVGVDYNKQEYLLQCGPPLHQCGPGIAGASSLMP